MLDIWTEDDKKGNAPASRPKLRQIVFINSAAAFLGLPGSIAYTRKFLIMIVQIIQALLLMLSLKAAKCAVRALADTLRMEVLRYNCPQSTYSIHCAFLADFVSPGFTLERNTKTPLTKRIQGVDKPISELQAKFPSSEGVSSQIMAAVDKGEFIICEDSLAASLLFTGMIGPSPKRRWGIVDGLLSPVVGWFAWPTLRWKWEAMTREHTPRGVLPKAPVALGRALKPRYLSKLRRDSVGADFQSVRKLTNYVCAAPSESRLSVFSNVS